jgi:hypothetical protein
MTGCQRFGLGVGTGLVLARRAGVFRLQAELHAAGDDRVLLAADLDRIPRVLRHVGREAAGPGRISFGAHGQFLLGGQAGVRKHLPSLFTARKQSGMVVLASSSSRSSDSDLRKTLSFGSCHYVRFSRCQAEGRGRQQVRRAGRGMSSPVSRGLSPSMSRDETLTRARMRAST